MYPGVDDAGARHGEDRAQRLSSSLRSVSQSC